MVCVNLITNFPMSVDDISDANNIFVPNHHALKYKTMINVPAEVPRDYVNLTKELLDIHEEQNWHQTWCVLTG